METNIYKITNPNHFIPTIAVVIPCYKVTSHVLQVLDKIGPEVTSIYAIDDCCPEGSGNYIKTNCNDHRVKVIFHKKNMGVGGAVLTGYKIAIEEGSHIIVKIDGDGQMDPVLLPMFIEPIILGLADYTKGNRFFDLTDVFLMPKIRILGNAILSFLTKFSSGYWDIFDPTNGFTAIHYSVASKLPFEKISKRYFFESDMLFRLNTVRAVVVDIPMSPRYGDEVSNLKISKITLEFIANNFKNFIKRIFYNYYLRDMSLASLELPLGLTLVIFGVVFGGSNWLSSAASESATPAGTVMLAALPTLMGMQLILAFFAYDISMVPRMPRSIFMGNIGKT